MSDTKKSQTCADCPFFKEPVCAKLRPCEKSLPVCADYPAEKQAARRATCNFPYVYLGLMQKTEPGRGRIYAELDYIGYRRAEMCGCDWDFLRKTKGSYGFMRKFPRAPKEVRAIEYNDYDGVARFYPPTSETKACFCNTATNGTAIQYGKAMQPWMNIEAFGLFLNEKGGSPKGLFSIRKKLTVQTNEHATFYSGSLEIPVLSLMQLKHNSEEPDNASV